MGPWVHTVSGWGGALDGGIGSHVVTIGALVDRGEAIAWGVVLGGLLVPQRLRIRWRRHGHGLGAPALSHAPARPQHGGGGTTLVENGVRGGMGVRQGLGRPCGRGWWGGVGRGGPGRGSRGRMAGVH
ncbi:hypothetical protein Pmani_033887 [Petrolisthes manimaculis]|uniref:Uncharacterized protein n=1 Tax=Petrolisthes manimaculis TaxID=1843537 RepID=A0AAE1NR21_9EUCA|nr:hypothetical protein Pmani_033887 [Petrolisthes manimaculis]